MPALRWHAVSEELALSWAEYAMGAHVGYLRRVVSIAKGYRTLDAPTSKTDDDVEGAVAELVVAKALRTYWDGSVDAIHSPDVDGWIHVRHSLRADAHLIVKPRDLERGYGGDAFVLVTGARGTYTIHGWILGHDAAKPEWTRNPNGYGASWFVPASALHPIAQLRTTKVAA